MQHFCDSTQIIFNLNILSTRALNFLTGNIEFNAHTYILGKQKMVGPSKHVVLK